MSNEYEFIFKQFTHQTRTLNFNEWDETYGSKKEKLQFNTKFQVEYNRPSGRVTGYNIKVMDFYTNKDVIMINYQADAIPFVPETEKFTEPTWKDFTDEQLKKAIKYLTPILEMKMDNERDHYNMLVFKDRFYIGIRIPHLDEFENKEHNLCITVYDVCLDDIK